MTDWIPAIVFIVLAFLWSPLAAAIILRKGMTDDTQHLIDAARLEGIRLGLEAADNAIKALYDESAARQWPMRLAATDMALIRLAVCALNPETIAKEADND